MDQFLTGKYTGIPAFIGIMGIVFWLTFNVIGAFAGNLGIGITAVTDLVDHAMAAAHVNSVVHSLVIDGIFNGVGGVLSFLPIIVTLFFSCRFWRTAAIWRESHLLWTNCCGNWDFPVGASYRC